MEVEFAKRLLLKKLTCVEILFEISPCSERIAIVAY